MKMQGIACALAVFVALAAGSASATESVSFDGQWWSSHSEPARLLLVEGEIDGAIASCGHTTSVATFRAMMPYLKRDLKQNHAIWTPKIENKAADDLSQSWRQYCSYTRPFGVYLNAVDSFYLSYPKRSTVHVRNILGCYNDAAEQAGRTGRCVKHIPSP